MASESNTLTITVGEFMFEFTSYEQWVKKASSWFKNNGLRDGHAICVDTIGRICRTGKQFMRARDEKTFPVRVYRAVIE